MSLMRNIHIILYAYDLVERIRNIQPAAHKLLGDIVVETTDREE